MQSGIITINSSKLHDIKSEVKINQQSRLDFTAYDDKTFMVHRSEKLSLKT